MTYFSCRGFTIGQNCQLPIAKFTLFLNTNVSKMSIVEIRKKSIIWVLSVYHEESLLSLEFSCV